MGSLPTLRASKRKSAMSDDDISGVHEYHQPAGGWGALRATAVALANSRNVLAAGELLLKQNQPDGFDCPGCAWPDPKHTSSFEFCENGAKAVTWEATGKRVTPEFFAQHTVSELWEKSDHWLEGQGRLTHPMAYDRGSDRFVAVSWDDAFARIARALNQLPSPDLADFYTSGRTSNEAAFLYQLFVRLYGTNNFPDCSNMCHEASSVGLPRVIGVGKGTVSIEDFDTTDMLFCIGHNPGTNHPRMMTQLRDASRRGVPIIVMNPLRERALERFEAPQHPIEMLTLGSTPIGTQYHQLRVGGDAAALKGIMKALLDIDDAAVKADQPRAVDMAFIREHTHGFEAFCQDLRSASWSAITLACQLSREALEGIAQLYARAERPIICYGMGVTQHRTGTANIEQIAALLLMRGAIGRAGAGICPLRGHSNVQGDRTVGITERPTKAFLDQLGQVFGFEPPRNPGRSVVDTLAAINDGRCKALVCLGGNLAVAAPDRAASMAGFRQLELNVGITTKLNRSHLLTGGESFLLPCLGRTEIDIQAGGVQSVTVEDSMSMVHASRGFVKPASEHLRSELAIVAGLAKATLHSSVVVDWDALIGNYDLVRDKIEAVMPELFGGFNARIREPGGFHLHNSASERVWNTPTGKANFIPFQGVEEDEAIVDELILRLTTLRSHDQYNTTIYGLNDRYRSLFGRRDVVFMNALDIQRASLMPGARADVWAVHQPAQGAARRVLRGVTVVEYLLPERCCGAYYPEANSVVALDDHDPDCLTPSYKSVPVRVVAAEQIEDGADTWVGTEGLTGRLQHR
jgi:molybdopterin-dependent oxidoreductase alpha subunit